MTCACGCGQEIRTGRRYRQGHNVKWRGGGKGRPLRAPMPDPPNPSGLCQCGCGLPTSIAKQTCTRLGLVRGTPVRFLNGHATRLRMGAQHPNWKGGRTTNSEGYTMVRVNGRYVQEHRVVMERILGRPLEPYENVHHKNGIRDDNRQDNLELWVKPQTCGQRAEDLVAWVVQAYPEQVGAELRTVKREQRTGQLRLVT